MPNVQEKKRKREDADSGRPRKSRVLDNDLNGLPLADDTEAVASDSEVKALKNGQSRQEKSERRSKKAKNQKPKVVRARDVNRKNIKGSASDIEENDTLANGQDFVPLTDVQPETKSNPENPQKASVKTKEQSTRSASRFIVFIGNLPYDASTAQIESHFVKLAPFAVRHRTDKATGRSKGFAFLEFDAYDKMKTCLKLYHHSIFGVAVTEKGADELEDNRSNDKKKGRRINVEMTAGGGGGKSQGRREKIKTKNSRLDEQRERRRVKEKAELEKATMEKRANPRTGVNADDGNSSQDARGFVHPSRMSRVHH